MVGGGEGGSGFAVTEGANTNQFVGNAATGNTVGINVIAGPGTAANEFLGNTIENSSHAGILDATEGKGDRGTSNIYSNNICNGGEITSTPEFLCREA